MWMRLLPFAGLLLSGWGLFDGLASGIQRHAILSGLLVLLFAVLLLYPKWQLMPHAVRALLGALLVAAVVVAFGPSVVA